MSGQCHALPTYQHKDILTKAPDASLEGHESLVLEEQRGDRLRVVGRHLLGQVCCLYTLNCSLSQISNYFVDVECLAMIESVVPLLAPHLQIHEIARLARTSSRIHHSLSSNEIWRELVSQRLGGYPTVLRLVAESSLGDSIGLKEDRDWQRFAETHLGSRGSDGNDPEEFDGVIERVERLVTQAHALLKTVQDMISSSASPSVAMDIDNDENTSPDPTPLPTSEFSKLSTADNRESLVSAANLLIDALDLYPIHVPSLHLLAFILFLVNDLDLAMEIVEITLDLDEEFEPALELKAEIDGLLCGLIGRDGEYPSSLLNSVCVCVCMDWKYSSGFPTSPADRTRLTSPKTLKAINFNPHNNLQLL